MPNSNNKISLDKNIKDQNKIPISNLFYKKSDFTLRKAKMMMEEFANTCRKLDIGRVGIKKDIYELRELLSSDPQHRANPECYCQCRRLEVACLRVHSK